MKTEAHRTALLALLLALACAHPLAAKSDVTVKTTTAQKAEKELTARPGLTTAEVDAAVAKASQLAPKMSVPQVEQIVGSLNVGGKGGSLVDMLNALPRAPGIELTATNGICRFDFVSDEKGRFFLKSWALLPGAKPSQ